MSTNHGIDLGVLAVFTSVDSAPDENGEVKVTRELDVDATMVALRTALMAWDDDRRNGNVKVQAAIDSILNRSKVPLSMPLVAAQAANILNAATADDLTAWSNYKDKAQAFISENSAHDFEEMTGKLYLSRKGKGGGVSIVTPALIAERGAALALAESKAAKKAAR